MGDKITALPAATSLDGTEVSPIVQAGTTKKVAGTILRSPIGNAGGDLTGSYPNPTLAAVTTAQAGVGSSTAIPVISVDSKGRVTSLSTASNPQGTVTSVIAGTGLSGGTITSSGSLSVIYGSGAGTAAQGNDSRFSTIPTASASLPVADGSAAVGTSTSYARADHVHPQSSVSLSGDISGVGTGSIVTSLANITTAQSGIGGLTQIPQISIDAKGRVTSLTTVPNPQIAITGLNGDVTATGPGVVSAQLSASGVTAGSYGYATTAKVPTFTVDAKGRIGSASEALIVLPTDKQSSTSNNLQFGSKNFVFSNQTDVIPYVLGQWITIRSIASPSFWMSGIVTGCTLTNVTVNITQSTSQGTTQYSSWSIRLGQTLNYSQASVPTTGNSIVWAGSSWTAGTPNANAVFLQNYPISTTAPETGQSLIWNGTNWIPQSGGSGNATSINGIGISGSPAPEAGQVLAYNGSVWMPAGADAQSIKGIPVDTFSLLPGNTLIYDDFNNKWVPTPPNSNATQLQSRTVASTAPTNGQVLTWDETISNWKPADAGSSTNASQIQGVNVSTTAPTSGQVLGYNGTEYIPVAQNSNASSLQGTPISSTGPASGQMLGYDGTNWTPSEVNASQLQSQPISSATPASGQALVYKQGEDSVYRWTPSVVSAVALQSTPVSATAPANGNLLKFDGTNWVPFDGIAFPYWNISNYYYTGDRVAYDNKIWVATTNGSGNTPSTGSSYWAENIGGNSGTPSNQSTPVYWLRITTLAGDGFMPIYV